MELVAEPADCCQRVWDVASSARATSGRSDGVAEIGEVIRRKNCVI
jgi:hypothetical protein